MDCDEDESSKMRGPHRLPEGDSLQKGEIFVNIYEAAQINKMLPPGFRFEFSETVKKTLENQNKVKKVSKKVSFTQ